MSDTRLAQAFASLVSDMHCTGYLLSNSTQNAPQQAKPTFDAPSLAHLNWLMFQHDLRSQMDSTSLRLCDTACE